MSEEITVMALAEGLKDIYDGFTQSVRNMGKKSGSKRPSSKLAASALHWLAGNRIKTERDLLCDKFLEDVKSHLELFETALEGEDEEKAQEACFVVAKTLTEPVPANSNSTSDLMKRAMISQLKPWLSRLNKEQLRVIRERVETAYPRSKRLPVEREVLKEIAGLLA